MYKIKPFFTYDNINEKNITLASNGKRLEKILHKIIRSIGYVYGIRI